MSIVEAARQLAHKAHAGQLYGPDLYATHCERVVNILDNACILDLPPEVLAAAWLHDVLEDTSTTFSDIVTACDAKTALLVQACTGIGANRKERNALIYSNMQQYPEAALIKAADRLDNVRSCVATGDSRLEMYRKEQERFCSKVMDALFHYDNRHYYLAGSKLMAFINRLLEGK